MLHSLLHRLAVLAALLAPLPAAAAPSALYVFGDSLSDRGNIAVLTGGAIPAPPYAGGRFSNGPIWVEALSAGLGLGPVVASLNGGTDYAYGGATATGNTPIDLQNQVAAYVFGGPPAPAGALFTLWAGANDILNALATNPATLPAAALAAAQAVVDAASALVAQGGARELLVLTLPDLGDTPRLNVNPLGAAAASAASMAFNAALLGGLAAAPALAAAEVHVLDTFGLLEAAIADPAGFGFSNVTGACVTGPLNSPEPPCAPDLAGQNAYLFWDGIHPTSAAHAIIGREALAAVPEPATVALFGLALFGLVPALLLAGRTRPTATASGASDTHGHRPIGT